MWTYSAVGRNWIDAFWERFLVCSNWYKLLFHGFFCLYLLASSYLGMLGYQPLCLTMDHSHGLNVPYPSSASIDSKVSCSLKLIKTVRSCFLVYICFVIFRHFWATSHFIWPQNHSYGLNTPYPYCLLLFSPVLIWHVQFYIQHENMIPFVW